MLSTAFLRRPARVACIYQPFFSSLHHDAALAEYTDTPQYPEIIDVSREANKRRKKEAWHQKVTNLPSVEQKMMELNMPKYFGHWSCQLRDNKPTLLTTDFCRFATRTHVEEVERLPEHYYAEVWQQAEAAAGRMAGQVEQLIDLNFNTQLNRRIQDTPSAQLRRKTQNFLFGLHRLLSGAVGEEAEHIRQAMVDVRPRIEAYWILGSLPPDNMLKKARRGVSHMKEKENDPMERPMQGRSRPFLGVRVEEGLPRVVDWEDPLATTGDLPTEALDPRAYGFRFKFYRATTVTGSWPSEGKQHGHLFLHTRELEDRFRNIHGQLNVPDAIKHKALLATFTQAMAHATYLGFGPVTEITYPLVQQSTFTDGQRWILGLYQLNTCALHSERAVQNPRNNILWLSEDQHLFECVEAGRVKGLNMSLLTALVAMYLKRGVPNPDPTPYLSFKYVSNHPASEEYRERFHQYYLRLTSNRPVARERPEMYLWEKIYKVDFNTRPLETPRRFFENYYKKEDPSRRPLNQHPPRYIPKSKRKEKRVKFEPVVDSEQLYKYD